MGAKSLKSILNKAFPWRVNRETTIRKRTDLSAQTTSLARHDYKRGRHESPRYYETPGGTILYYAHNELERICLDRQTYSFKATAAVTFSELIYNGMWFTPLREAISAFVDKTQESVTGKVKLKLYKGNIIPQGISSPYSLYSEEISSFTDRCRCMIIKMRKDLSTLRTSSACSRHNDRTIQGKII